MKLHDPDLLRDRCFVGGKWIGTPETEVTDPATGEVIGKVPHFGAGGSDGRGRQGRTPPFRHGRK